MKNHSEKTQLMQEISLIIATYNRGSAIATTLQSVLEQTRSVDEIIVVDDGSTDNTVAFIRQEYPQVIVLKKENGGTSSARNHGARHATYPWLVFLDHDDVIHSHAIEKLAQLSKQYPEAASLHADHVYDSSPDGPVHPNHHYTSRPFERLFQVKSTSTEPGTRLYNKSLYTTLLRGNLLQQPFAVRRDAFWDINGYQEDVRYCEDWDLYLRLSYQYPVALTDEVISTHVIEGGNLHLTAAEKQEVMYERVLTRRREQHSWLAFRRNHIIRKKLASIYKSRGDRHRQQGELAEGIRSYLLSALNHPSDYVVLVRILIWSLFLAGSTLKLGSR
ncbi:glycosyltransferase [bacterium]|nr:glycosyltransferase [bacterium]